MTWKETFDKAVACFKSGDLERALAHMNQAVELEGSNFIIYDSRAAVHEKLGNIKAALLDSKRVIELAPERWQGYARSARLFDLLEKRGHAIKMVDLALNHLRSEDHQRRTQLVELREKVVAAKEDAKNQRLLRVVQTSYLLGKLPVETLAEIFSLLINEDHTWAIRLSHISGHWRRILINTPSAWRTLVVSKKHPLRKAKLWKERAKKHITHISIDVPELDLSSVLAALKDLSWSNLSSLRVSSVTLVQLHQMLTDISIPHTFSNLDELSLFKLAAADQLSHCLSTRNWRLEILRLDGYIHMVDKWWEHIQQLKELHLDGELYRFSTLVFAANPSLETFVLNCSKIYVSAIDPASDASFTPASMYHLKTIKLEGVTRPSDILRYIFPPCISHFSLSSAIIADETILVNAGRGTLVELHIVSCHILPVTLPILLSSTPNLETLQVSKIQGVVNEMFRFLTPKMVDSTRGLPCRALQHVDVSHCPDLTTSSAYAFVKTRAQYASESVRSTEKCEAIVSLKVDGCPNVESDILPWFRIRVAQFSCVYATRKDLSKDRRRVQ